ncbi:hypothetical protein ACIQ9E_21830 [Streptomyces sp. NPDC094448]|uniref:hypothetical protein n=1 Tax=Streptomyces sp. NPDC094448 TaxID=3366063 RepID=UPI00382DC9DC
MSSRESTMTGTPPIPPGTPPPGAGWGPVPPTPPASAPEPSRVKPWLTHGATAAVALIIGIAIGGSGGGVGEADGERPAPTVTAPEPPRTTAPQTTPPPPKPKPTPTAKPGPATSFEGDGMYLVGEDIAAGTYRTDGAVEDDLISNCYWARHKDASGEFASIIANDNVKGQTRVTVNKGEYLEVKGCQPWKKAG